MPAAPTHAQPTPEGSRAATVTPHMPWLTRRRLNHVPVAFAYSASCSRPMSPPKVRPRHNGISQLGGASMSYTWLPFFGPHAACLPACLPAEPMLRLSRLPPSLFLSLFLFPPTPFEACTVQRRPTTAATASQTHSLPTQPQLPLPRRPREPGDPAASGRRWPACTRHTPPRQMPQRRRRRRCRLLPTQPRLTALTRPMLWLLP